MVADISFQNSSFCLKAWILSLVKKKSNNNKYYQWVSWNDRFTSFVFKKMSVKYSHLNNIWITVICQWFFEIKWCYMKKKQLVQLYLRQSQNAFLETIRNIHCTLRYCISAFWLLLISLDKICWDLIKLIAFTALSMTFASETGNFGCEGLTERNTRITIAFWSYGLDSHFHTWLFWYYIMNYVSTEKIHII